MRNGPESKDKTEAFAYDDISDDAGRALVGWDGHKGMTYSPKNGRAYGFETLEDALALHQELVKGGEFDPDQPIYLVGITCHKSRDLDGWMEAAYAHACTLTNQPLFGAWRGEDGEYVDVVIPIAFNNDEDAIKMGIRYDQQSVTKIKSDGSFGYVSTD